MQHDWSLSRLFECRTDVLHDDADEVVLYFVREKRGPYKIGVTSPGGAEKRLAILQVGNPRVLTLAALFYVPKGVEGLIHGWLTQENVRGEWFKPGAKLDEVLWTCEEWFEEAPARSEHFPRLVRGPA